MTTTDEMFDYPSGKQVRCPISVHCAPLLRRFPGPVELILDQTIGKLFVTRVAGNIATADLIASLEYGVAVLRH